MSFLFLKKHLKEEMFKTALETYSEFLTSERYSSFPLEDTLAEIPEDQAKNDLIECVRLVETCSDAITDVLKGNPRQIKRFLNAYWIRQKLSEVSQLTAVKNHILVKLMVLEYINAERFEDVFRAHRQNENGIAEMLAEMETCASLEKLDEKYSVWRSPRLWKWLKSDPQLADEDLRDYFWLSRSAVGDTLAGVRLLTQAMRQCLEDLLSEHRSAQVRSELFTALSDDEQAGVLAMVSKEAVQNPDGPSLESLLELSLTGSIPAAETFCSCVKKIDPEKLKPGLGVKLRSMKLTEDNRVSELINQVRSKLAKTETRIGRALKLKKKPT